MTKTKTPNEIKTLCFIFACISGFAVANIYYNQPLLVLFAQTFHRSVSSISIVLSTVQFSYAAGLILFVPLGDKLSRRKLIITLLVFNTLSLVLAGVAPNFISFCLANAAIGATSIIAQIIIPTASILSQPEHKAKNVATVISGLAAGIMFARTLSGFIGHYAGWRTVYFFAGGVDIILLCIVIALFPRVKSTLQISYVNLLRSLYQLFFKEKLLRHTCFCGALSFAAFNAFWGSLAYLLSLKPYGYSSNVVGIFGLAGIVSIISSRFIGMLSDRVGVHHVVTLGAVILGIAFLLIWQAPVNLWWLIIGAIVLDLGGRTGLISNQLRLFSLASALRSRLNTVFMASYLLGGSIGTRVGIEVATVGHWRGLAILGITIAAVIFIFNFAKYRPGLGSFDRLRNHPSTG
ncbi:MAG: MFS transporter [Pseudomonadota bacterium]